MLSSDGRRGAEPLVRTRWEESRYVGVQARGACDRPPGRPLAPLGREGPGPTHLPRGIEVEPIRNDSGDRVLAGLRADERSGGAGFLLSTASQPPHPETGGPVRCVEVVLKYRCGAAPDSRRVPFSLPAEP